MTGLVALGPRRPTLGENTGDSVGTAVLGGGPAGLTAAYVLAQRKQRGIVYEADGAIGGIAKTFQSDGYRFDLGGQRFVTKLEPIAQMWDEILGDDILVQPRRSRLYFGGKYFAYPIRARDVISRLGMVESGLCTASYLAGFYRSPRHRRPETFEQWVTTRFGARLYYSFFRSYAEKVWGISGSEIQSDWAAQRINSFSLPKAARDILRRGNPTPLVNELRYPRLGPGQMWEAVHGLVEDQGIPVRLDHRCVSLMHAGGRVRSVVLESGGNHLEARVDGVLSSIPLGELMLSLDPAPPERVLEAAGRLRFRSMCVVALMTDEEEPFPDNWIYLQDTETRAGCVQNFGAWSKDMVQPGGTCLGVEYFCSQDDDIWHMDDADAVEFAKGELGRIGLIDPARVFGGVKIRVSHAYPIYDPGYVEAIATIRSYLERFENLETFGRNGLHRYNNQDHSMWTAILATMNLLDGTSHDVWALDPDRLYFDPSTMAAPLPGDVRLRV